MMHASKSFDLVAFDVDGTLVESPGGLTVWEVLNDRFVGSSEINRERFERFKRGELSYSEWVELDISGWREAGARRESIVASLAPLRLVPGTRETMAALRESGLRLIVVSGTLDLLLETLYPDHPFEEIFANRVSFDEKGRISGWEATPYDMQGKAEALRRFARREAIPIERCAFVGDSVNDVWIAREAGFSIAFNPRCEDLERAAGAVVRGADLRAILPHLLDHSPSGSPSR
jgi:phosphoserine phosphatase